MMTLALDRCHRRRHRLLRLILSISIVTGLAATLACGRDVVPREGDGLDVSGQSRQFREDYALFANRCSKCHGLARPLNMASRNSSEEFWERYVERMRRQPGSGISAEDGVAIRRFLREYSRLEKGRRQEPEPAASVSASASAAPPESASSASPSPPSSLPSSSSPVGSDTSMDGGGSR